MFDMTWHIKIFKDFSSPQKNNNKISERKMEM